jgi:hypothetical protein
VKIERFEDIKAWQEARVPVKKTCDATKLETDLIGDYKFREQIHSAAISVIST